jgi:putative ABC transport system permease protein
MLGHYVSIAFRSFRRTPASTAINVVALALGLICFVIAWATVQYWGHAESHFAKADRTFAIARTLKIKSNNLNIGWEAIAAEFTAKYLKLDFPEFESVTRVRQVGEAQVTAGAQKMRLRMAFADPTFFDVFDLPFAASDAKHAFAQPDSVVLSDVAAMSLFGTTDAVGRTIRLGDTDIAVTGVLAEFPAPSHIGRTGTATVRFDILASWDVLEKGRKAAAGPPDPTARPEPENWFDFTTQTYVVLPEGSKATPASLAPEFAAFVERRVPKVEQDIAELTFGMIPIRDMMAARLNTVLFAGTNIGLSVTTLLILFGGLILLVACLNYANLATAQAMRRTKEVGLRKTIGASRRQIMTQYILEASLQAIAALGVALIATATVAPVVKNATEIDLTLALFSGLAFWGFVAGLICAVTLLAGAYPAIYLSGIRPIQAIRAAGARPGRRLMPTLLVGAQFVAASFLLIAVIVMTQQTNDLRRTGLGATTDPVIVIPNARALTKIDPETLRSRLLALPQVKSVSSTNRAPWSGGVDLLLLQRAPGVGQIQYTAFQSKVDFDFFKTMDMPLVAGRPYERDRGDDKSARDEDHFDPNTPVNLVIDSAFSRQLGFASPRAAVDQIVYIGLHQHGLPDQPVRIIGVVSDRPLHFVGLGASASVYRLGIGEQQVMAKISRDDVPGAIKAIKGVWNQLAPDQVFQYEFEDQLFAQGYEIFGRVGQAFVGLAAFAFAISTIGLVAMGFHVANRRRHEIGVRKTLGASTRQILVMLLRDFSKPVIVANVIAWPLAYLAVNAYLSAFLHRITVTPLPFALSFAITLVIAWAAVGGQAMRAARVKPASVLRYE